MKFTLHDRYSRFYLAATDRSPDWTDDPDLVEQEAALALERQEYYHLSYFHY